MGRENAIIESTMLGTEDHGIASATYSRISGSILKHWR